MVIIDCSVIKVYLNTELCSGHDDIVGVDTLLKNMVCQALHFTPCNLKYLLHCVPHNNKQCTGHKAEFCICLNTCLCTAQCTGHRPKLYTGHKTDRCPKWSAPLHTSIGWRIVHYFQECFNHHFPLWFRLRMRVNGYQIPPGSIIAQEYNMYRVNGYQIPAAAEGQ